MSLKLIEKIKIIFTYIVLPFFVFILTSIVALYIVKRIKTDINILISQSIANLLFIFLMVPYYVKLRKKYNLVSSKVEIRSLMYMIPLSMGLSLSLNIILGLIFPDIKSNDVSVALLEITDNISIYLSIFIVGIITPITEEILFRGLIYDGIKIITNKYIAIIMVSLIFAITHGNIEQGIYAFIVGVFFGYILEKYHSIYYTIVMHCVMNSVIAIFQKDLENVNDIKNQIFLLIIMFSIFVLTLIRINIRKEEI